MAAVNYTEAQVSQIVDMYTNGDPVEEISVEVGKSVRSVIAKLSREGVYVKQERNTKPRAIRKSDIVAAITRKVGFELPSLVKATREDLVILANFVSNDS